MRGPKVSSAPIVLDFVRMLDDDIEIKYFDTGRTQFNVAQGTTSAGFEADPATALCLNAIVKGYDANNRIGDKIKVVGIELSFVIQKTYLAYYNANSCFVSLVLDKQTNGAQLNSEDVYTKTIATGHPHWFRNPKYMERFVELESKLKLFNTTTNFDGVTWYGGYEYDTFKWEIPMNLPVNYKGNAGTVADIADNSLHIIAHADFASLYCEYQSRVHFVDL